MERALSVPLMPQTAVKLQGIELGVQVSQLKRTPLDFWTCQPMADLKLKISREKSSPETDNSTV